MGALQTMSLGYDGPNPGRRTKLTPETTAKILEYLSKGNYIKTSCEAAGVDYKTLRSWITQGERDRAEGNEDTPHARLIDAFTHARAQAEAALVSKLDEAEDWRASAFKLERGYREHWGKDEQTSKASVVVQLPAEVAGVLLDALSVGSKHLPVAQATPAIDASFEQLEKPTDSKES